jgi:hypothetical protein
MTAIDFPNSPSVGNTHSAGGRTWIWTGSVWNAVETTSVGGATGPTGPTGPQSTVTGPTGATGATGPTGPYLTSAYTFSATTTNSDPGNGIFRLNTANASLTTAIYIDNQDIGTTSRTAWYDTWDDSSSTIKGILNITNTVSPSDSVTFTITGSVGAGAGYYSIPVSYLAGNTPTGSAVYAISFYRYGDLGSTGPQGSQGVTGPSGATGPTGPLGLGLNILDYYANLTALQSAHPTGSAGQMYLVSDTVYIWDTGTSAWVASNFVYPSLTSYVTLTGTETLTNKTLQSPSLTGQAKETITTVGTGFATSYNFDVATSAVVYITANSTANGTVNFRASSGASLDSFMSTGQSVTCTLLLTNSSPAYYPNAFQIDGSSVTPKWAGGTAPTSGNASSVDMYSFTIVKTASATFTVLATQLKYA